MCGFARENFVTTSAYPLRTTQLERLDDAKAGGGTRGILLLHGLERVRATALDAASCSILTGENMETALGANLKLAQNLKAATQTVAVAAASSLHLMSTPDRQELIRNAVAFLSDPKTQSSSLAQRVQFLEAKGLTSAEIEEAFKYATNPSAPPVSYQPLHGPGYGSPLYPVSPSQQWDWRDYFITAVFSGSIAYGAVSLFKKYLLPHLQPPTSTAYEEDRDALNAQFDAAEALLKEIQAETAAVRTAVAEQKEKVDQTTQEVEAVVNEMREAETKTRDDMREIREEVNNVREMLPKMIDKVKESQSQSLTELQQELKSLKALLLSRGTSISSTPSSPLPTLASRPSIPAWQLARPTPSPAPAITDSVETTISSESLSGSKGKEVDVQQISGGMS